MREISIKIPDGKTAVQKEVNGNMVIELVDEAPITERVKTFSDALREVGIKDSAEEWEKKYETLEKSVVAYMKLSIITDAINEGWKQEFERKLGIIYFPIFFFYTKEDYSKMNEDEKSKVISHSYNDSIIYLGVKESISNFNYGISSASMGIKFAFKTKKLSEYAGHQFIEIWADYLLS